MLVEAILHRTSPDAPPTASPADGIRVLALLPAHWRTGLSTSNGAITLRLDTPDDTTPAEIQAALTTALTDPALHHWRLDSFRPVPPPRT
ncbi:hypothetical protein ABGB17_25190 [Sphaerisporangium sp. B11E5]|uniref:hypothetical protein n=1 Tax=Sphaerisporangium sp. B11E5 TaxID=3153563 RepID=UPI00325D89C1